MWGRDSPLQGRQPCFVVAQKEPKTRAEYEISEGSVDLEKLRNQGHLSHYHDKFGAFRTAHHQVGGFYWLPVGLPYIVRDELRNHFVFGYTPFGMCGPMLVLDSHHELNFLQVPCSPNLF